MAGARRTVGALLVIAALGVVGARAQWGPSGRRAHLNADGMPADMPPGTAGYGNRYTGEGMPQGMAGDFPGSGIPGGPGSGAMPESGPGVSRWARTMPRDGKAPETPVGPTPGKNAPGFDPKDRIDLDSNPGNLERFMMDEEFTGMTNRPGRRRRRKSKTVVRAEDANRDPNAPIDVDTDQCMREAAKKGCSMRVMQENFAQFSRCVFDMRESLTGHCQGWAEHQGVCLDEMVRLCSGDSPPETTKCLLAHEAELSDMCRDSTYFDSMKKGFEQMMERLEQGGGIDALDPAASHMPESFDGLMDGFTGGDWVPTEEMLKNPPGGNRNPYGDMPPLPADDGPEDGQMGAGALPSGFGEL